ncbi:hypothetical protein CARUB_v10024683mg [Capsella rubella]|uniref:Uncharacterized protein n=1 Tax=Capsella rubella TaxID=81985 RepID=R0FUS0_9BRAS|nr:hypothetical protein CARUB_v10024683mg [Capsella rubella]
MSFSVLCRCCGSIAAVGDESSVGEPSTDEPSVGQPSRPVPGTREPRRWRPSLPPILEGDETESDDHLYAWVRSLKQLLMKRFR